MHAAETALHQISPELFSRELRRFQRQTRRTISPGYTGDGITLPRPVGRQLSGWLLLVPKERRGVCPAQMEVPDEAIYT